MSALKRRRPTARAAQARRPSRVAPRRRVFRARYPARGGADAGLSLIEVLVAIAVLTVGMLGLLAAIFAAQTNQRVSASRTVAANHARAVMESLLAYDETGAGYAIGMAEAWETGFVEPILSLPDERVEVLFFSPDDPGLPAAPTPLTVEDFETWGEPFYVEVTVTWRDNRRPMQLRLTRLVNPVSE